MWRTVLCYLCCTLLNHRAPPSSSSIRVHYIILLIAMTKFRGYPVDLCKKCIPTPTLVEIRVSLQNISHFSYHRGDLIQFAWITWNLRKFNVVTQQILFYQPIRNLNLIEPKKFQNYDRCDTKTQVF